MDVPLVGTTVLARAVVVRARGPVQALCAVIGCSVLQKVPRSVDGSIRRLRIGVAYIRMDACGEKREAGMGQRGERQ